MDNYNFFQKTPQKDEKENSWSILPGGSAQNTSIVPVNQPGTGFGQPSSLPFGRPTNTFPQNSQFGSNTGMFGSTNSGGFGQTAGGSNMFGNITNTLGTAGGPSFSNPITTSTTGTGFNNTGTGATPLSSNASFGTGFNTTGTGFGSAGTGFNNTSMGFNNTSTGFNNTSTGFNTAAPSFQSTTATGTGFGTPSAWSASSTGWNMNTKGSKVAPYSSTRIKEDTNVLADLIDITGMSEYSNKSIDEIRKEDYEMSFCPPKTTSGFGVTPGFSSTAGSTGIGLPKMMSSGGMSFDKPVISSSTPFGTTQNTSTSPFGSIQQPSVFGTTSSTTGLFGQQKPATGGMFSTPSMSTNQPSSTPFGSTSMFGGGSGLTNQFGAKPAGDSTLLAPAPFSSGLNKPPTTSLFGQQQPSSASLFGQQQPASTTSLFNQQQPSNLFNQQQPSNLFGQPMTTNTPQPTNNNFSSLFTAPQTTNPFSGTTTMPSFSVEAPQFTQSAKIDLSDPFLIKNINFEKFEQQKPSIKVTLPTPIFKTNKNVPFVDLKIRPPKTVPRSGFYTIPDLKDLDTTKSINNLVLGFEGKGRIEFLEPVSVTSIENIERKVIFRNENVEINDPIGTGLNKRARVYIEGLYPFSRATNKAIKGAIDTFPEKGIQERFIYQLKNDSQKKFVDYNVESGIYVYEVNHF